jgi:hypothetical protein
MPDTPAPEPTPDDGEATEPLDVAALWRDTQRLVEDLLGPYLWVEEELDKAAADHPEEADLLYHLHPLAGPSAGMPTTEWLVRAHARELAARTVAGADLRPATDAEVCVLASEASLRAPLTDAALGLYARCFARCYPGESPMADLLDYQERMHGPQIDDLDRTIRRQVATRQPRRRLLDGRGRPLAAVTCAGRHHGQPVPCRFARPTQPTLDEEAS